MSFRLKQKYRSAPCTAVFVPSIKTLETGALETHMVDDCETRLPEPELFDLEANIKAGVNLKETSSKILEGSTLPVGDFINANLNKEVNDEE